MHFSLRNTSYPALPVIYMSASLPVFMTGIFGCLHSRLGCIVLINRARKRKTGAMLKGKMAATVSLRREKKCTGQDPKNRPPPPPPATPALVRSG